MFVNEKTQKLINSICEVNIDGKMALLSLYDDLPHFEYDLTIDNLENSNKKLKTLIQELKEQIKKLQNENSQFKSLNSILSKNISSLYKTAKSEIQRKDKIIEELRKSKMYAPLSSKKFSYNNISPFEKTQNDQFSNDKKKMEHLIKVAEKSNVLNENNNYALTNAAILPNYNIPKTVYYTRLCHKLGQQNQINVSKNEMPKDVQSSNTISTDNISQGKNEEFNNDKNKLKEMPTPSTHNDSENNPNSTLVICETDSNSSDCEQHNTTPINTFENSEKGKENVSVQSFFPSLKLPTKLKKKMVITPATIGIQNMHYENMKSAEISSHSKNLVSKTQCLNTDIKSTCNNEYNSNYESTIDDKQLIMTNEVHNKKPFTSNNSNQMSKNIEVEHVPFSKEMIIEKEINSLVLKEVKESSHVTCVNHSNNNESYLSENVKFKGLVYDKKKLYSSELKNNQLDSELSSVKHISNLTDTTLLNDSVKSSSNDTSAETRQSSINIEVEQIPFRRKAKVIGKDNNNTAQNEARKSSYKTCISPSINKEFSTSTRIVKCLSLSNEVKSPISSKQKDSQLEPKSPAINYVNNLSESIQLNDSVKHYSKNKSSKERLTDKKSTLLTNIEVEQIPFRRKTKVIEKDNNTTQTGVRKSLYETGTSPSINKEFSNSTRIVKCLSLSNEIKSPISSIQKNSQLEPKSPAINPVNNLTDSIQLNRSVKHSFNDKSCKKSLLDQTSTPSINIEVEQGSMFRRSSTRRVITLSRSDNNKQETKKGRRVQLITIQDHFSQPLPSFYGAKKTEIDVSKNSIHIEKVVESSSHFYVPLVKRRRTMNFGNADS